MALGEISTPWHTRSPPIKLEVHAKSVLGDEVMMYGELLPLVGYFSHLDLYAWVRLSHPLLPLPTQHKGPGKTLWTPPQQTGWSQPVFPRPAGTAPSGTLTSPMKLQVLPLLSELAVPAG